MFDIKFINILIINVHINISNLSINERYSISIRNEWFVVDNFFFNYYFYLIFVWTSRRNQSNCEFAFKFWSRFKRQTILFFFVITHELFVDDYKKEILYFDIFYRIQTINVVKKVKIHCSDDFWTTKIHVNNLKQKLKKKRVNKFENNIDERLLFKQIRITIILKSQFVTTFLSIRMISS